MTENPLSSSSKFKRELRQASSEKSPPTTTTTLFGLLDDVRRGDTVDNLSTMIRAVGHPIRRWLSVGSTFLPKQMMINLERSSISDIDEAKCSLQYNMRSYLTSTAVFRPKDDVHVTIETTSSQNKHQENSEIDSKCGPIDDEEMEQEEMFVTSDPILGHGKIQEWGGPRRGGRLAEPTRFGDWERKGRCTDF